MTAGACPRKIHHHDRKNDDYMKALLTRCAIATAFLFAASGAQAGPLTIKSATEFQTLYTTSNFGHGSATVAGPFTVSADGSDVLAFCIDPATFFVAANVPQYAASAFTGFDNSIQSLYANYYESNVMNAATATVGTKAAFQLALWELYADDKNVATGNLAIDPANHSVAALNAFVKSNVVISQASSMIASSLAAATVTPQYAYTLYSVPGNTGLSQSIVSAARIETSEVPEPATYGMFGAGLALMSLAMRRRNRK